MCLYLFFCRSFFSPSLFSPFSFVPSVPLLLSTFLFVKVRTGEVCLTSPGPLPFVKLLHSVGPRYNEQYKTAAENALHCCYRNALRICKEEGLRTVVITPVYTERKRYPRENAGHVVLRTVRRFLEKWSGDIDRVVFAFGDPDDRAIYERLAQLYFPRTLEELAFAELNLPADVGNGDGEMVILERKIRISSFPTAPSVSKKLFESKRPEHGFKQAEPLVKAASLAARAPTNGFGTLVLDQDALRVQMVKEELRSMNKSQKTSLKYERLLRDSRAEDLSDVAKLGFIYKSGRDINGRSLLVIVARHLPTVKAIDMNRVLLYIIRVMDSIVEREYSVVYVHSESRNQPALAWMREVTGIFNRKYKKNLKKFFVVHPTFWVKMVFWTLSPIVSDKFWSKLKYIKSLAELEKYLEIEKLDLPDDVIRLDRARSGSGSGSAGRGAEGGKGGERGGQDAPVHVPTRISDARKEL